jgi:phosphopantothenoylcysteine synthetase/decarboxylase
MNAVRLRGGMALILITAGPTREALDPVRFLSNRSSGRMGYAVAEAAQALGHEVILVSGPVALPVPSGVRRVSVVSAQEMFDAVADLCHQSPPAVAVHAAAVADYRPVAVADQKIKKTGDRLVIECERTADILGSMRSVLGFRGVLVGFAAETENVLVHGLEKLRRKGCDLLAANDVSRSEIGFDTEENDLTLIHADGHYQPLGRGSKQGLAQRLWLEVERLMAQVNDGPA